VSHRSGRRPDRRDGRGDRDPVHLESPRAPPCGARSRRRTGGGTWSAADAPLALASAQPFRRSGHRLADATMRKRIQSRAHSDSAGTECAVTVFALRDWRRGRDNEEDAMGLMDVVNDALAGSRGQAQPGATSGGGMSPITMAMLGLLAYKALAG